VRVVFKGTGASCRVGQGAGLAAVRIAPGGPPAAEIAWCAAQEGLGSPMVTTTNGRAESIVWRVGAEGDERLIRGRGAPIAGRPVRYRGAP
jgi:hypothetical protein